MPFLAKALDDEDAGVRQFDHNDCAGFWWGNCLNTFTRNVAAECDEYGYRFDMTKNEKFDPVLTVAQLDGTEKPVDVRSLPYVRFEDNEAHTQRRHAFNLGGFGSEGNIKDRTPPSSASVELVPTANIHSSWRTAARGTSTGRYTRSANTS